jgi:hypothetical protein
MKKKKTGRKSVARSQKSKAKSNVRSSRKQATKAKFKASVKRVATKHRKSLEKLGTTAGAIEPLAQASDLPPDVPAEVPPDDNDLPPLNADEPIN